MESLFPMGTIQKYAKWMIENKKEEFKMIRNKNQSKNKGFGTKEMIVGAAVFVATNIVVMIAFSFLK